MVFRDVKWEFFQLYLVEKSVILAPCQWLLWPEQTVTLHGCWYGRHKSSSELHSKCLPYRAPCKVTACLFFNHLCTRLLKNGLLKCHYRGNLNMFTRSISGKASLEKYRLIFPTKYNCKFVFLGTLNFISPVHNTLFTIQELNILIGCIYIFSDLVRI